MNKTILAGLLVATMTLGVAAPAAAQYMTVPFIQKVGEGPSRAFLAADWVGVGGPGDPDCNDRDAEAGAQGIFVISFWNWAPNVGIKGAQIFPTVPLPDAAVTDPTGEVDDLCDSVVWRVMPVNLRGWDTRFDCFDPAAVGTPCDPGYANDPQQIGYENAEIQFKDFMIPTMEFADTEQALAGTLVSCQFDGAVTFVNEVDRGAADLEPVAPSESIDGTLDATTCIDQTGQLTPTSLWPPGSVNREQDNTLGGDVAFTSPVPGEDMAPGIWAMCFEATIQPVLGSPTVESDYSWVFIDDENLAFSALWSQPAAWDSDPGHTASWTDLGYGHQDPCDGGERATAPAFP